MSESDRLWTAAATLALDAAAAEVLGALEEADVPSVLLKGPALAALLYSADEVRPYGDIDVLVPFHGFGRAAEVLERLGFVGRHAGMHHHERFPAEEWYRPADGVEVDLHQSFRNLAAPADDVWSRLYADSETLVVASRPVRMPSVPARLLIVALHAIQHGPNAGPPMEDLRRAVARVDDEAWTAAAALARQLGGAEPLSAGLRLLPDGAMLADRLGLDPPRSAAFAIMASAAPTDTRDAALRWARLHGQRGLFRKATFLMRRLRPSRTLLALSGDTHVTTAYPRRLLDVARSMARGRRAWSAAARESGERIGPVARLEVLAWSGVARVLIAAVGLDRTLAVLDRVPHHRGGEPRKPPATADVRAVGTCLHRSVARSQYLRTRGAPHQLVIGVAGPLSEFQAHAWLSTDPAPEGFSVLHTIER